MAEMAREIPLEPVASKKFSHYRVAIGDFDEKFAAIRQQSATFDEGAHLPAGYSYLRTGAFRLNPEHPPLIKLLAAIPLRLLGDQVRFESRDEAWALRRQWEFGRRFLYRWNDAGRLLLLGRLPMVALGACLGLAVFWWTRRHCGLPAASLAG